MSKNITLIDDPYGRCFDFVRYSKYRIIFLRHLSILCESNEGPTIRSVDSSMISLCSSIVLLSILRILRNQLLEPSLIWSTVHKYGTNIDWRTLVWVCRSTHTQIKLIFSLSLNYTLTVTTYGPSIDFVGHLSALFSSSLLCI